MTRKEKATIIAEILEDLYPKVPIPLQHKDPYTLLIAVMLSAQSTDKRVNLITPKLFALADTPQEMVKLTIQEIEEIIRPCGLAASKAKGISHTSEKLIKEFNAEVPDNFKDLESLAGVGHKTASVVMSQAFGHPAFPVDTHIHRLAWRWMLSSGKNVVKTEADLKRVFPQKDWNKLHLQIIFFGREYCPARGHNREECPICSKYGRVKM